MRGEAAMWWMGCVGMVGLLAGLVWGCGSSDDGHTPARQIDTGTPDTESADTRPIDRPDTGVDVRLPTIDVAVSTDATTRDAYALPPNSITTCGDFFTCLHDCPPEVDSCTGPCHDAMTHEAESAVQRFLSCVTSHACQGERCIMEKCGPQMKACFEQG